LQAAAVPAQPRTAAEGPPGEGVKLCTAKEASEFPRAFQAVPWAKSTAEVAYVHQKEQSKHPSWSQPALLRTNGINADLTQAVT